MSARSAAISIALCLPAAATAAASASDSDPAVHGPPSGTIVGRLVDLGFGNGSGGSDVRTADGRTLAIYAGAPPFVVDGVRVECPIVPRRGHPSTGDECPSWPRGLVIGRSIVRVPYWHGTRFGHATRIATGFTTVGTRRR